MSYFDGFEPYIYIKETSLLELNANAPPFAILYSDLGTLEHLMAAAGSRFHLARHVATELL